MINLRKNEKVIIALHKHWFDMLGTITALTLLVLAPLFILPFISGIKDFIMPVKQLEIFLLTVYWMTLLLIFFVKWVAYWLDQWIITNERVIDIEQKTLFSREISEFTLSRIQDVTIEIPSITATLMKFGNIRIQTAGERSFVIRNITNPERAKTAILNEVFKLQQHVRSF